MANFRSVLFDPERISYYRITPPYTVRDYPAFGTTEVRFGMRFLIPDGIVNLADQDIVLESVIAQLLNDLFKRFEVCVDDRIRLVFHHPEMISASVSMPLVIAHQINPRNLLNFIESLLRSGESFWLFDGHMIVNFTHFKNPQGQGSAANVKYPRQFRASDRYNSMRSVVTINPSKHDPDDNLCCARAIVVSLAKVMNDKNFKKVAKSERKLQSDLARQLHADAGVAFGPCGLPELDQFQKYLAIKGIQLIAFNANANREPMNESPLYPKLAAILHDEGHYHAVIKPHRIVGMDFRCGGK